MHLDNETIATRLIALLPTRTRSKIPSRETLLGGGAVTKPRAVIFMIFIYVTIAIFMMGAQWIAASREPPAQLGGAHAPASTLGMN